MTVPGSPGVEAFQVLITRLHDENWKKYNDVGEMEKKLYQPLNPYWIPPDGHITYEWHGNESVSLKFGD